MFPNQTTPNQIIKPNEKIKYALIPCYKTNLTKNLKQMINYTDMHGNTALWDAIAAKHYKIFQILLNYATISDPNIEGDLLTTATERNDIQIVKDLLNYGLNVNSTNHDGLTALQVALATNQVEVAKVLISYGAKSNDQNGHIISNILSEGDHKNHGNELKGCNRKSIKSCELFCDARVNLYKGHPFLSNTFDKHATGRLIKLPSSFVDLKTIAGMLLHNRIYLFNHIIL